MINRTEEIEDIAAKFYLNDEKLADAFIKGAEWADKTPSEETINKIMMMRDQWLLFMMKDKNSSYISLADWVRENW